MEANSWSEFHAHSIQSEITNCIFFQKLFNAARLVLFDSLPAGRDALETTAAAIAYSPLAVLAPPLRVLLYIWDALLMVQVSPITSQWFASTYLTQSKDKLFHVSCPDRKMCGGPYCRRERDHGSGCSRFSWPKNAFSGFDSVRTQIYSIASPPFNCHTINRVFEDVRGGLLREAQRSFITRYLRRRDSADELGGCDIALTNALSLFSVSIFNSLPTLTHRHCCSLRFKFVPRDSSKRLRGYWVRRKRIEFDLRKWIKMTQRRWRAASANWSRRWVLHILRTSIICRVKRGQLFRKMLPEKVFISPNRCTKEMNCRRMSCRNMTNRGSHWRAKWG